MFYSGYCVKPKPNSPSAALRLERACRVAHLIGDLAEGYALSGEFALADVFAGREYDCALGVYAQRIAHGGVQGGSGSSACSHCASYSAANRSAAGSPSAAKSGTGIL